MIENAGATAYKLHEEEILDNLANKLTTYLNFCLQEKTKLLYN